MNFKNTRKALAVLTLIMSIITIHATAFAAEKSVSVNLEANTKDITFKIVFSQAGDYTAVLQSPEGEIFDYTNVDGVTYTCDIESAKAGKWVTNVTAAGDVPKYSLSVNAKKETATSKLSESVSVGRDIVGLNVHFKDRMICLSWADASIGAVEVNLTNLDNAEILCDEDVSETHFEYDIPEGVSNVSLSVVPTESRNVNGAKSTYTYTIPSRPTSTVTYDDADYINKGTVDVSVHTDDSYSFYAEVNGRQAYKEGVKPAGEYKASIPVSEDGENVVAFYLVDSEGNMFSYQKTFILDTVAPTLEMEREYDQATTSNLNISLNGTIKDYDSFTINGENVTVTSDGTFSHPVTLHVGENSFDVVATDKAGNETSYNLTIIGLAQKSAINPMILFAVIMVVIVLVLVFVLVKIFKRSSGNTKKLSTEIPNDGVTPSNLPVNGVKLVKAESKTPRRAREKIKPIKSDKRGSTVFWAENKNFLIGLATYGVALFILLNFILCISYIASGSMEPTLMTGDCIIENRLAYVIHKPQKGDIISFKNQETKETMGKRIIGVAGDHIEFFDGYVYINGEQLDESAYLDPDIETNCAATFDVPDGCVFVLGDNRENSNDSRFWQNPYVRIKDIKAKYLFSIPLSNVF